jgi:hypothetical protein
MYSRNRPNADGSPESLEVRLRALPLPPVPAGLEARLLATTPLQTPVRPWRWAVWAGAVGPLAAASLVAILVWPGHGQKRPVRSPGTSQPVNLVTLPSPPTSESAHQVTFRPPDDPTGIARWLMVRRALDVAEMPAFAWPLSETSPIRSSTSIPPELLD